MSLLLIIIAALFCCFLVSTVMYSVFAFFSKHDPEDALLEPRRATLVVNESLTQQAMHNSKKAKAKA